MCNCKKLIEVGMKSKHRSKWIKQRIRKLEKIENRTNEEQLLLCISYSVATNIPFDHNPIYDACAGCEHERIFCYGENVDLDKFDSLRYENV
jgi:hypothetical protein